MSVIFIKDIKQSFLEATRVKTNLFDGFAEHMNEYFTGKH